LFGDGRLRRLTQDSPVLASVWQKYAKEPDGRCDLLLTPHRDASTSRLARAFNESLAFAGRAVAGMFYNDSYVVGRFTFQQLICLLLPLTKWHREYVWRSETPPSDFFSSNFDKLVRAVSPLVEPGGQKVGTDGLDFSPDMLWLIRVAGLVAVALETPAPSGPVEAQPALSSPPSPTELVDAFARLTKDSDFMQIRHEPLLWLVNLNRSAEVALWRSRETVKADVAERTFNCDLTGVRWAVIDTGIDATHPAFRKRDARDKPIGQHFKRDAGGRWVNNTRIVETYDFPKLRQLVAAAPGDHVLKNLSKEQLDVLDHLEENLASGRAIAWDLLGPLIRVPHDISYPQPAGEHGTHVAGILAGDWRTDDLDMPEKHDLRGICPSLEIYDLRVFDEKMECSEFTVSSALQFIRFLNQHSDQPVIHGVNISISIRADVDNYACGRTPVCEDCERLVRSGVVVVAAAGNAGYQGLLALQPGAGFQDITITDPGNAQGVITVGATHRVHPHTYGVSYFSSRGPTADGRRKPDLLAPGEKILGPVPGGLTKALDGTSMAVPHVSGAAAMLLGRYRELIGQPDVVKRILMGTATDLSRDHLFQGAGLVDVLRALQSV
jgi:hypothetical protein